VGRGLRLRDSGYETGLRAQAAVLEACLVLAWPFKETGCSLKELFPAGIIAMGMGNRSGIAWKFFDSSQAHSRGS